MHKEKVFKFSGRGEPRGSNVVAFHTHTKGKKKKKNHTFGKEKVATQDLVHPTVRFSVTKTV